MSERRAQLVQDRKQGRSGLALARDLSQTVDELIRQLYHRQLETIAAGRRPALRSGLVLLAVGGYGRRELCPFSDIDLLLLRRPRSGVTIDQFVKKLVQDAWDVGLSLSQCLATPAEILRQARQDIATATSLLDARWIIGDTDLSRGLNDRLLRLLRRRQGRAFFRVLSDALEDVHQAHGGRVDLLEPNVKRSPGGLRHRHLVHWLQVVLDENASTPDTKASTPANPLPKSALATVSASSPISDEATPAPTPSVSEQRPDDSSLDLAQNQVADDPDPSTLAWNQAYDFLLGVRFDLHLQAKRANDVLTRDRQVLLAEQRGYVNDASMLGVEQFMRDYFRHANTLAELAKRESSRLEDLVNGRVKWALIPALPRAADLVSTDDGADLANVTVHRSGDQLVVSADSHPALTSSWLPVLTLARLMAQHRADLDHATTEHLRQWAESGRASAQMSGQALSHVAHAFVKFLDTPGGLAQTLRSFHRWGLLELLIPDFSHARGLIQFNPYHHYTVDEHTLEVLAQAESLADDNDTLLGSTYQKLRRKDLLHLAILMHDLAKGRPGDHSQIGAQRTEKMTSTWQLAPDDAQLVTRLVQEHLTLAHLAFHRDVYSPRVHLQLSRTVGNVETLRLLFVLTVADVKGVGPGAYNQWKHDLLTELYWRTEQMMLADEPLAAMDLTSAPSTNYFDGLVPLETTARSATSVSAMARQLRNALLDAHGHTETDRAFLSALPDRYLAGNRPLNIVEHLKHWRSRKPGEIVLLTDFRSRTQTIGLTVLADASAGDGFFHQICGAFSAHQLEVLSARIHSLNDGSKIEQFEVMDKYHTGTPSPDRLRRIEKTIGRVLKGELAISDLLWSTRSSVFVSGRRVLPQETVKVKIDNTISKRCTVIDVYTQNRRGLLYTMAKRLWHLGLTVVYAAIGTYEDEVVDVFYVVEADGKKVARPERVKMIQDHLKHDIARLARDPRSMGF